MKLLIANILLPLPTLFVLFKYAGWRWVVVLIILTVCIGLLSYLFHNNPFRDKVSDLRVH